LNHSPENCSNWSLPPVLPRHDFFTKKICRLLPGGDENPNEFAGKQCYARRGTMPEGSTGVTGARKASVALTATGGYSQQPPHDEMEFADHHCRRPKRRVIRGLLRQGLRAFEGNGPSTSRSAHRVRLGKRAG